MNEKTSEKGITQIDINKEMREAYLQYSMSVIVGRALPDVRDGLKPVHRRILFAMHDLNNTHDKPYKKSARIVGDVIGKYHPHGDVAVYDTMVRMAQDFSLRNPLIDGQGNFGSIDGDSPAAQRYTEVRMTKLAEELLEDIEKETVLFGPNYDDSLQIPLVLPSKFPNLLVNGSSGIAVGMATNIPPHNLGEIVDGCLKLIDDPEVSIDELMQIIPGPDFPSAGVITGKSGLHGAYKKGRGVITLKAVADIETIKDREYIIISEIPYQVNKARLIESIADLVHEKKIEGISDIRDESSREGMRIAVQIKRNENASVVLNRLFKFTQLQVSFGIIMLALDARNQPQVFDLKAMLEAFVEHRKDVVTRRSVFELKKAEAKAHILEGLKKAVDEIDAVIKTIRASSETKVAKENLIEKFGFSDLQAQAILDMRLAKLTGLERQKIEEEIAELKKTIEWLKKVLSEAREIYKIIADELRMVKEKYADKRLSKIEGDSEELEDEDLIASEDVVVTMTDTGYVKRIPIDQYRLQKRGGKGLKGAETRESDFVSQIFVVDTKTTLLVFTNTGKVYWSKVHKLPQGNRTSKGRAIANVVNVAGNEKVLAVLPVVEFSENSFVVMLTRKGIIKKTALDAFSRPRPSGIIALTTDLDDQVLAVKISSGKDDIFIATHGGMSIRFSEDDVRPMGRGARGVKAITLGREDFVVSMDIIEPGSKDTILLVAENGYGKRTEISEYRVQGRGGVGIITQRTTGKVGRLVAARKVEESEEIIVTTDQGQSIRMAGTGISIFGRNTQGVRVIDVKAGEIVSGVAILQSDDDVAGE